MKHVIIAGASRSGKTTLSLMLAKRGLTHYKMDAVKRGLDNNFCECVKNNWKKVSPKMSHLIATIIKENEEDLTMQKEYYVIDTCHVYPKDLSEKDIQNTIIIFLGYQYLNVEEKLRYIKKHDLKNIWTHKISDEENRENLVSGIDYSKEICKEAKKYNIKYFDTSKKFQSEIEKAYQYILEQLNI